MNLEELISKYLDGELTNIEDELLRGEIASNDLARDKFDASVNLHMNIREDAENIETPADLFEETQEMILARISSDVPFSVPIITNIDDSEVSDTIVNAEPRTKTSRNLVNRWKKNLSSSERMANESDNPSIVVSKLVRRSSLVLAAMLILMVSQIDHKLLRINSTISNIDKGGNVLPESINDSYARNNQIKMPTASSEMNNKLIKEDDFDSGSALMAFGNDKSNNISSDEAVNNPSEENNGLTWAEPNSNEALLTAHNLNGEAEESNGEKLILEEAAQSKSIVNSVVVKNYSENNLDIHQGIVPMQIKSKANNYSLPFDNIKTTNEVQISSFLGTEIYRGGIESAENQVVSNFSQSIAYSVTNHDRMGVEVGYTEYTYNENVILNLPIGSVPTQSMVEVSGGGGSDDLIAYPVKVNKHKPMYWGAAFYEKTLFDQYGISLNGRLGFGGSGDGPMTYSRLFGKYEIFPFMSITFGADGRFFTSLMQSKDGESKDIKSSVSLIYGLQVKF